MFEETLSHFEGVVSEFDNNVADNFNVTMHDLIYDVMHQRILALVEKEQEAIQKKFSIEEILSEARIIQ